jgi:D-methionine transport system ATP-binding protein
MLEKDDAALRMARRGIGMVFQHFNLLSSRSVADNVAFPLAIAGIARAERARRVAELLALVGLTARSDAYPAQLSGGQKQRVGIARALASRPRILLFDEATSALDPETTGEILALLRRLRDALDLTAVLVTHEMAVVKAVCDRVAVIEGGSVVEQGRVAALFTRPAHATTRRFVAETIGREIPEVTRMRLPPPAAGESRWILRVLFTGPVTMRAVISQASRRFELDFNILSGRIDEIAGEPFGVLTLAAYGAPERLDAARAWLLEMGVGVEDVDQAEEGALV